MSKGSQIDEKLFIRRVLILFGLSALVLLVWVIADVLLLVVGVVLVAILLHTIARPLQRRTGISRKLALTAAVLFVISVLIISFFLFGSDLVAQAQELIRRLPEAWNALEQRIGIFNLDQKMMEEAQGNTGGLLGSLASLVMAIGGGLAGLVLVLVGGIYLAAAPATYRKGALMLIPEARRELVGETADAAGNALRMWLLGQLIAMIIVGLLTTLGLWLLGMPSPLALGLLAGLAEFVPLVGPIVASIPALLLAAGHGGDAVLWTLGLYVAIQQIEGNPLMPLIQQRTVAIPAAVTLFAVVAAGIVFGWLGVLFATPLLVVSYVAVKKLYVRETLGEPVAVPGEDPVSR